MTQEEKARAYDEALERLKPLYEQAKKDDNPIWSTYEYLVPELAESEDERIRKGIIEIIKAVSGPDCDVYLDEKKQEKYLAWLEKQKEQKLPLMDGDTDTYFDDLRMTTKPLTSREWFEEGIRYAQRLQEEQKPAEWSDTKELVFQDICKHLQEEGYCGWVLLLNALRNGEFQPKQEWSEEDGNVYKTIMDDFNGITPMSKAYKLKAADWLKSLPERFNLEPKQEWNEEDEEILDGIINTLDRLGYAEFCKSSREEDIEEERFYYKEIQCLKKLKSLRPSWKPSEEQMKALLNAEGFLRAGLQHDSAKTIAELYEQLKKLM